MASSSSSEEELDVEVLDSISKLDGALQQNYRSLVIATDPIETIGQNDKQHEENKTKQKEDASVHEQLQNQVTDLTNVLNARDLEITRLRNQCTLLTRALEQKDMRIAELSAETMTTRDVVHDSIVSVDTTKEKLKQVEQQQCILESQGEHHVGSKAIDLLLQEDSCVTKDFETSREDFRMRVNLDQILYSTSSMESKTRSSSASVYSTSSTATASSSSSLFGDGSEVVSKPPHSWTSPKSVSIVKRRPSLERQHSSPIEETFARSAGFLRKSNRTMSARLSVRDLGLLRNDDDAYGGVETPKATPLDVHKRQEKYRSNEGNSAEFADTGGSSVSVKNRSQRNLFADIDEALEAKIKRQNADFDPVDGSKAHETSLTYGEFLQRVSQPASRDILDKMRLFVSSILGPRGDGRPPRSTDYVEYDFYGTHEFRRRCNGFFESMGEMLLNHSAWRHASDAKLAKARDGIEKYVMDKVSDIAFNRLKECHQWVKEDEALLQRMQLLSFITPAMLDIKPCMRNEVVWSMAVDELRRINSFRSPGDKINCIVRCCGVIFSVLNLSRGDSGSRPGADDFLPVFIYIVLHSQIPRLYSNCEYISAYRNQADLMSKAGYCFVNLRSAIEFIMVMNGSMLSIPDEEFQRLYSEREKRVR